MPQKLIYEKTSLAHDTSDSRFERIDFVYFSGFGRDATVAFDIATIGCHCDGSDFERSDFVVVFRSADWSFHHRIVFRAWSGRSSWWRIVAHCRHIRSGGVVRIRAYTNNSVYLGNRWHGATPCSQRRHARRGQLAFETRQRCPLGSADDIFHGFVRVFRRLFQHSCGRKHNASNSRQT